MRIRLLVPMLIAAALTLIASSIQPAQANSAVTIVAVGDVARAKGGQAKTAALTKNLKPEDGVPLLLFETHMQRQQQQQ